MMTLPDLHACVNYIINQLARMQCTQDMADRIVSSALEEYESAIVMQALDPPKPTRPRRRGTHIVE